MRNFIGCMSPLCHGNTKSRTRSDSEKEALYIHYKFQHINQFASPLAQIFFLSKNKTKIHCNQPVLPRHLLPFIQGGLTVIEYLKETIARLLG